ncbi:MAG TPA: RNA polymerase sigma factor [Acidimicrobiales bacterium]|nr:RNA polymerase sigma factor [Acidimicrobiales bacterium]
MVVLSPFSELLAAAQTGDEAAFAAIFRATQPRLLRYLRVMSAEAADDVAGETWVDVAKGLGRFRGDEGAFRGWVFTMARHRLFDWQRAAARRLADPVPTEEMAQLRARGDGDDPAATTETSQGTAEAIRLVALLPPDQAEVVLLRAVAGLDVSQVADITGKTAGAVRVLAHRGLRRLAEILAVVERTEV